MKDDIPSGGSAPVALTESEEERELEAGRMREELELFEHRAGLRMLPASRAMAASGDFERGFHERRRELRAVGVVPPRPPRKLSLEQFYEFSPAAGGRSAGGGRRKVPPIELPKKRPDVSDFINPGSNTEFQGPTHAMEDVKIVTRRSLSTRRSRAPKSGGGGEQQHKVSGQLDARTRIDPIFVRSPLPAKKAEFSPERPFAVSVSTTFTGRTATPRLNGPIDDPNIKIDLSKPSAYQRAIDRASAAKADRVSRMRDSERERMQRARREREERCARIGEPFRLRRVREEEERRREPPPPKIVNTIGRGRDGEELRRAMKELDEREEAIREAKLARAFEKESRAEDGKRLIKTLQGRITSRAPSLAKMNNDA